MYEFDLDKAEGSWSVEKFKTMNIELYKQCVHRSPNEIHISDKTRKNLEMGGLFISPERDIVPDVTKPHIVGRFGVIEVIVNDALPDNAWTLR